MVILTLSHTRERVHAKGGQGVRTDVSGVPPKRDTSEYLSQQKTQSKTQQHQAATDVEKASPKADTPAEVRANDDVALSVALLLREGVSRKRAQDLAETYALARIERQLRYLADRSIKKSRIGTLIDSIIDDWCDPTQTVAAMQARGEQIAKKRLQDQADELEAKEKARKAGISEARDVFVALMADEQKEVLTSRTLAECVCHPNWKKTKDLKPDADWKPDQLAPSQKAIFLSARNEVIDLMMAHERASPET